jgi:hypothetical protein
MNGDWTHGRGNTQVQERLLDPRPSAGREGGLPGPDHLGLRAPRYPPQRAIASLQFLPEATASVLSGRRIANTLASAHTRWRSALIVHRPAQRRKSSCGSPGSPRPGQEGGLSRRLLPSARVRHPRRQERPAPGAIDGEFPAYPVRVLLRKRKPREDRGPCRQQGAVEPRLSCGSRALHSSLLFFQPRGCHVSQRKPWSPNDVGLAASLSTGPQPL